jgi:hypothetical protein
MKYWIAAAARRGLSIAESPEFHAASESLGLQEKPSRATSARELGAGRRRCHYRIAPCVISCGEGTSGDRFRLGR